MSDRKSVFESEFPSTLEDMADTLRRALEWLLDRRWIEKGEEFCARLCLEEALVNAVVHGNRGDQSRKVRLTVAEEGDCCRIAICDEGEGCCPEAARMPDAPAQRGRGLCLIRHFMDQVTYNREKHCLEMRMRRGAYTKGGSRHE
ncbi:MAG: ATP-binding protein [Candidatus Hydrogenedentes bacterium]|nr:ATP-binding protein [Candidatus Hydrogenedentota bacterium]